METKQEYIDRTNKLASIASAQASKGLTAERIALSETNLKANEAKEQMNTFIPNHSMFFADADNEYTDLGRPY